jgi:hypothetical protein
MGETYADFDFILSLTVSHNCKEERCETSVAGITFYPPRCGVAILAHFEGRFVGVCSVCGQEIAFTPDELKERL